MGREYRDEGHMTQVVGAVIIPVWRKRGGPTVIDHVF